MCTIPVLDAAVLMHTLHIYTYTHMLVHKCHKEIHPSRITYTPGTGVTIEPHTSSSCAVLVHMYTYTYLSYTCTQSTPCLAPIFLPYKAKTVAQQQHSSILDDIHQYSPVFTKPYRSICASEYHEYQWLVCHHHHPYWVNTIPGI